MHTSYMDHQESLQLASVTVRNRQLAWDLTKNIQLWILIDGVGGLKIRGGHTNARIGARRHRLFGLSDDADRDVWHLVSDRTQDLQRSIHILYHTFSNHRRIGGGSYLQVQRTSVKQGFPISWGQSR